MCALGSAWHINAHFMTNKLQFVQYKNGMSRISIQHMTLLPLEIGAATSVPGGVWRSLSGPEDLSRLRTHLRQRGVLSLRVSPSEEQVSAGESEGAREGRDVGGRERLPL